MKIHSLKIRAIRGFRHERTIHLDGKSLLISGENGTGKSSIELALRWALTGEEGPTTEEPFSTQSSLRRHIKEPPSAPFVEVSFGSHGVITATPDGVTTTGSANNYMLGCQRAVPFLRRSALLNVIKDRPGDRFKYFESFLDLDQTDEVRETLAIASAAHEVVAGAKRQRVEQLLSPINRLFPPESSPSGKSLGATWQAIGAFAVTLKLSDEKPDSWAKIVPLAKKAKELSSDGSLEARRLLLTKAGEELKGTKESRQQFDLSDISSLDARRATLEASITDAKALKLLEHAKKHLEANIGDVCPVCGQQIDKDSVLTGLGDRLDAIKGLKTLLDEIDQGVAIWKRWLKRFCSCVESCVEALGFSSVDQCRSEEGFPASAWDPSRFVGHEFQNDKELANELIASGTSVVEKWADNVLGWFSERVVTQAGSLPPPGAEQDLRCFAEIIEKTADVHEEVHAAELMVSDEAKKAEQLTLVSEAIRKARQDVAKELFEEIGENVSKFYHFIHPRDDECEVTGAPSIVVQGYSGGTAKVQGEFDGHKVKDPSWVYSDGHLDTVGICIFLALRRFRAERFSMDPKVMVLDDVVLSIDLGHAKRFIELLQEEFGDHQIILLTHNKIFAKWCSDLMTGLKQLVIHRWSLENGPELGDYHGSRDRLLQKIEGASEIEIAQALMTLLDEFLQEARYAYQLPVEAKRGEQYTIGDIWPVLVKRVKKMEKTLGVPIGSCQELFPDVRDVGSVRNYTAAHINEWARDYPLKEMRKMGEKSLELVSTLYCFDCGNFARPTPNANIPDIVVCRCKKLTYVFLPPPEDPPDGEET